MFMIFKTTSTKHSNSMENAKKYIKMRRKEKGKARIKII